MKKSQKISLTFFLSYTNNELPLPFAALRANHYNAFLKKLRGPHVHKKFVEHSFLVHSVPPIVDIEGFCIDEMQRLIDTRKYLVVKQLHVTSQEQVLYTENELQSLWRKNSDVFEYLPPTKTAMHFQKTFQKYLFESSVAIKDPQRLS